MYIILALFLFVFVNVIITTLTWILGIYYVVKNNKERTKSDFEFEVDWSPPWIFLFFVWYIFLPIYVFELLFGDFVRKLYSRLYGKKIKKEIGYFFLKKINEEKVEKEPEKVKSGHAFR